MGKKGSLQGLDPAARTTPSPASKKSGSKGYGRVEGGRPQPSSKTKGASGGRSDSSQY